MNHSSFLLYVLKMSCPHSIVNLLLCLGKLSLFPLHVGMYSIHGQRKPGKMRERAGNMWRSARCLAFGSMKGLRSFCRNCFSCVLGRLVDWRSNGSWVMGGSKNTLSYKLKNEVLDRKTHRRAPSMFLGAVWLLFGRKQKVRKKLKM